MYSRMCSLAKSLRHYYGKNFFLVFISVNCVYWLFYFYSLKEPSSILGAAFFFITSLLYYVFWIIARKMAWKILRFSAVVIFVSFSLINFIHYRVLKTFLFLQNGYIRQFDMSFFSLLNEYVSVVPFYLAIFSFLLLAFYSSG